VGLWVSEHYGRQLLSCTLLRKLKYTPVLLLSQLPFWLIYILSDISFLFLYYLLGYRKAIVRKNLTASFPEKAISEIKAIEKAFYRHFTDLIFESGKFLSVSEKTIRQRFKVLNPEVFEGFFNQGRSLIMYTAHYGNWEWLAAIPLSLSHKVVTFYQPLRSAYYEALMKDTRERFGAMAVPSKKGYKTVVELGSQGVVSITCIIGDQRPKRNSSRHWVKFLNQDTPFLIGADRIARKTNYPVFFPLMKKTARGHYTLEFIQVIENPNEATAEEIIERYASILEKAIIETPHLWLWSHNRWKLKREENE
jgi:Kdo2-lipid IVA lauroyltransferase/acyltransferase